MHDQSRSFDLRRIAFPMVAYLGFGLLAATQPPSSTLRLAGVVGMVASFTWILLADLLAIRHLDEPGRRIHAEAAVLTLAAILGLMGVYAVIRMAALPMPRLGWFWLPPLILTAWGLCIDWASKRHR